MATVLNIHPGYIKTRLTPLEELPEVRLCRAALRQPLRDVTDHTPSVREAALRDINSDTVLKIMDRAVIDRQRVSELRRFVANGHSGCSGTNSSSER